MKKQLEALAALNFQAAKMGAESVCVYEQLPGGCMGRVLYVSKKGIAFGKGLYSPGELKAIADYAEKWGCKNGDT